MNDTIDAESRALAVVDEPDPQANVALFGTSDPVDVIARAVRVADALKAVVVTKGLVSKIQGKEYPQVEAWQTLAVMLGLSAVCEWSRPVPNGWEARVVVQRNGLTIAAAEAQCLNTEKTKKSWEDYAIRSMAQTRAISKSLRSVLGFVMVLSGFQATPAEEMPDSGDSRPAGAHAGVATPKASPPAPDAAEAQETARLRSEIRALWKGVPGEVAAGALEAVCGTRELRAVPRLKLEEFLAKSPSLLAAQQVEPPVLDDGQPLFATTEASRETAHRALMALCSKEGVSDEVRHRIAMMRFGLESTKHLNAADLRTLRELCARYVVDAPGDAFEAWLEEVTA